MVIVKLTGGLGNQMFQYSFAKRIAYLNKVTLKLDISEYQNTGQLRSFNLKYFQISADIATPEECHFFANYGMIHKAISKLRSVVLKQHRRLLIKEQIFYFDPTMLDITVGTSDTVYLDGYWQSERYFSDIADIIRSEFKMSCKPDITNQGMIEQIQQIPNSVTLHIRRGDYVSEPSINQVHGTCSLEYYKHSIKLISDKLHHPHFFIFSDDPEWAKQNLHSACEMTFVTHNTAENAVEDLRLMSLCKHNIVANSTFSWWGAWLNTNPDKIIVAPQNWFKQCDLNKDIVPESWLRI